MSRDLALLPAPSTSGHDDYQLPSWRNIPDASNHFNEDPQTRRKRDIDDLLATSSDPPLFSSDDGPSAAENYIHPRLKRQRKGPWWDTQRTPTPERQKRNGGFTRNMDSAVWMGSDDTEEGSTDNEVFPIRPTGAEESKDGGRVSPTDNKVQEVKEDECFRLAMKYIDDPGLTSGPVFPYWIDQPDDLDAYHETQKVASTKVEQALETGRNELDLSSLDLKSVLSMTLRPLRHLTRPLRYQTRRPQILPSEDFFEEFAQPLNLNLAQNQLDVIPEEVYNLTKVKFLSIRSNNITEILPSISRLQQMTSLSVGCNQLRWLPGELIDLMEINLSLEHLTVFGNPLIRPLLSAQAEHQERMLEAQRPIVILYLRKRINTAVLKYRTETAYLSIDGTCIPGWAPCPSQLTENIPSPTPTVSQRSIVSSPAEYEKTHTPSLFELSLRACYHSPNLAQLPFLLPETCPPSISKWLKHAWRVSVAGGTQCSICRKEYLIPRTEWVEWWYCPQISTKDNGDPPTPFMRRGCSWACAPVEEEEGPMKVIGWALPD